ncbi:MAG TPA: hypothetical protein VF627_04620 [Abditibacterium sp.]|jgi:protein-tyrosine-phosphatase
MQIVFVCSGNTCRSPLALTAWHLATRRIAAEARGSVSLTGISATSAGLCASPGAGAARHTLEVAREWSTDLSEHRAQLFRPQHARADLIVTMTRDQADVLRSHFEVGEEQVQLLGSYVPRAVRRAEAARLAPLWGSDAALTFLTHQTNEADILDPFGSSLEAYQECGAQIRRCVWELAHVLARLQ